MTIEENKTFQNILHELRLIKTELRLQRESEEVTALKDVITTMEALVQREEKVKSEKVTQERLSHREKSVFQQYYTALDGMTTRLSISTVGFPDPTIFLEHVFDNINRRSTSELICRAGPIIFHSKDLGKSWRAVSTPNKTMFFKCFSTNSGRHLLLEESKGDVHLFDQDWKYLGKRTSGKFGWHGSWSVDQSKSGTIMYCEYAAASDVLQVMRSTDDGENWSRSFSETGDPDIAEKGNIRHFHTCQCDPFEQGHWYLSSGDRQEQNRVWKSTDDGLSWSRVLPQTTINNGQEIPGHRKHNVLRHTSEYIDKKYIYWVTDDNLGTSSRLVRMKRSDDQEIELLTEFGKNELRNLIVLEDDTFGIISESKLDLEKAEFYCVDKNGVLKSAFEIPNKEQKKSALSRSSSSKHAIDGKFFSFSDALLLEKKKFFLVWDIKAHKLFQRSVEKSLLEEKIDGLRSVFGEDDDEVKTLERVYDENFRCNVCFPELDKKYLDPSLNILHDSNAFHDERKTEYFCAHCQSRVRQRTVRLLFKKHVTNLSGHILLVSTINAERKWLSEYYESMTHVALQGDFRDPEIIIDTDITNMPHIDSNTFDMVYAIAVLDYIPDLTAVAREVYRVLRVGGEFCFFIMPYRLTEDDSVQNKIKHTNALSHEKYANSQKGEETGIPDCLFSIDYIRRSFEDAGMVLSIYEMYDPPSRTVQKWFIARRP